MDSLASRSEVEVGDLFVLPPDPLTPPDSPPWLFRKLSDWSLSGESDAFSLASLQACVRRHHLRGDRAHGLTSQDRAVISASDLDVLLCATLVPLSGDCGNLARLGVWSVLFGEPEFTASRPPFWREVREEQDVSRVFLLAHDDAFGRGRIVESFAVPTLASLRFTLNLRLPVKAAALALSRGLLNAADRRTPPVEGEEITLLHAAPHWPSSAATAGFICRKLGRSAMLRARSHRRQLRWSVGIRPVTGATDYRNVAAGGPFLEIPNPPGHCYADPFIVESQSRHWLFVEDWVDRDGRACLACMEVGTAGQTGEPVVILEKPYHLSYPHVFRHDGDFFMIPETCGDGTVQLYRASRFPFEWRLETVLMEGVRLVDTTPFFYDGVWYFFTSTAEEPEEACLFTSARIDGAWRYHPANPIATDVRRLRGAGRIACPRDGNILLRPAQDCSRGYGYAVAFNEIRRLSPADYEERPAGVLLPDLMPGLKGIHTFNSDSAFEVIDWQKLVRTATV